MTRIRVQRGSSSTRPSSSSSSSSSALPEPQASPLEEVQEQAVVVGEIVECLNDDLILSTDQNQASTEDAADDQLVKGLTGLDIVEKSAVENSEVTVDSVSGPPLPPVPSPKPWNGLRPAVSGTPSSNPPRIGPSRRPVAWPVTRTSPTESRPFSPRSHGGETEGYNSADEQSPCFVSSYDDNERERQFEMDIRRVNGLEVKKMLEDGNCLFRAVADQVYGDSEAYDLTRQMCMDYMERERDHFSQFITEGFSSYCKRKRRDKVYGNNAEIQALSEMYNRPIHIYSYSTEPINTFHGSYNTDNPPIRLSFHHGNHYNSLVDPRRLSVGAGLGFSCLRGVHSNVDKDQIKAAIAAQQDQQIDNALMAEGRFYSDLELTEKEIERMVVEISRAEYHREDTLKQKEPTAPESEPSSSGGGGDGSSRRKSMELVVSMGFGYLQAMEAYSLFGDDVDSMVSYLLEGNSTSRLKGKAAE